MQYILQNLNYFVNTLYSYYMNITDWNNDEIIRLVMAKGHVTQKVLLEALKNSIGEKIPQSTFSCKIRRNALKLAEFQQICKILGYSINIKRIEK